MAKLAAKAVTPLPSAAVQKMTSSAAKKTPATSRSKRLQDKKTPATSTRKKAVETAATPAVSNEASGNLRRSTRKRKPSE